MLTVEELIDRLQLDLTRKTTSFAEYLTNCSPYIPPGAEPLWDLLVRTRDQERQHADLLARTIVEYDGVPSPGVYDEGTSDANYLHIFHLYELLKRSKESSIRMFEKRIAEADGYPAARHVLGNILEDERRQLAELTAALDAARSSAGSAAPAADSGA